MQQSTLRNMLVLGLEYDTDQRWLTRKLLNDTVKFAAGLGTWRGLFDVTDVFDQCNAIPTFRSDATTCGPRLAMQLFTLWDLVSCGS